jgi:hypothetical protein
MASLVGVPIWMRARFDDSGMGYRQLLAGGFKHGVETSAELR